MSKEVDGVITELAGPASFEVVPLELATFAAQHREEVLAFRKKVRKLHRAVQGALKAAGEAEDRIKHIRQALIDTPDADPQLLAEADELDKRLNKILTRLRGDQTLSKRNEPTPPSISARVSQVVSNQWRVTSPPTQTQRDAYRYAGEEFTEVLAELRQLIEKDLTGLEGKLETAGAPWTPGRVPTWQME